MLQHVVLLQEVVLVTGNKIGALDQIRRTDRPRSETQMRDGDGAGLLGVVYEVPLRPLAGFLADDLDRVFVRPDRAIGAETKEHRTDNVVRFNVEVGIDAQRRMSDVVDDADGKVRSR